jgi:hypothetical protein
MLLIATTVVLTGIMSSALTMHYVTHLPADEWEYMQLENRWLNWPEKECYTRENIELLIEGPPKYEQNKKTYIASIASQLIWITR